MQLPDPPVQRRSVPHPQVICIVKGGTTPGWDIGPHPADQRLFQTLSELHILVQINASLFPKTSLNIDISPIPAMHTCRAVRRCDRRQTWTLYHIPWLVLISDFLYVLLTRCSASLVHDQHLLYLVWRLYATHFLMIISGACCKRLQRAPLIMITGRDEPPMIRLYG